MYISDQNNSDVHLENDCLNIVCVYDELASFVV